MDKKLLLVLVLSVGTVLIFNHYSQNNQKDSNNVGAPVDIRPGQAYKVPKTQDLNRPINKEIDFLDKKITKKEEISTFDTDVISASFSNYGGVISGFEFKKHLNRNSNPLKTILRKTFYEREQSAFILALDEKTPFYYDLIDSKVDNDSVNVVYQTSVDNWIIKKSYTLYKDSYKVDLKIDFENKDKDKTPIRARLFIPAPFIGEIEKEVQVGVVITPDGKSAESVPEKSLDSVWAMPSIFGAQDKYFVNTLISDNSNFVQRGFFNSVNNRLSAILEGPELNENSSFTLSFYIGPKLIDDLAIDNRLEGLLDFGWLSWLCKLLLKFLEYLYSLLGNFGLAIIVMTVLLKIPFMPMTIKGSKKMKEYQKHMPALTHLRQKYKNDPQKLNAETMRFHKERNLSPTAQMSGCLPYLVQMPILFALYRVLNNYLGLYHAPFFGWITDLSVKDPYYILPILMGISMIIQQRLAPIQDEKTKTIMLFMPIFVTAMFISFPAGLVLYWFTNNLLLIGESYLGKVIYK
ncbi:MAG: membrane protein insertase YidC [bacterium]